MSAVQLELIPGARAAAMPAILAPMLPTLAEAPFSHPHWSSGPKLDGMRVLARVRGGAARILSRRGNDDTVRYPALARELASLPSREVVVDGEIVAPDEDGRPSFHRL